MTGSGAAPTAVLTLLGKVLGSSASHLPVLGVPMCADTHGQRKGRPSCLGCSRGRRPLEEQGGRLQVVQLLLPALESVAAPYTLRSCLAA